MTVGSFSPNSSGCHDDEVENDAEIGLGSEVRAAFDTHDRGDTNDREIEVATRPDSSRRKRAEREGGAHVRPPTADHNEPVDGVLGFIAGGFFAEALRIHVREMFCKRNPDRYKHDAFIMLRAANHMSGDTARGALAH